MQFDLLLRHNTTLATTVLLIHNNITLYCLLF